MIKPPVIGVMDGMDEWKMPISYYLRTQFPDAKFVFIHEWSDLETQLSKHSLDILVVDAGRMPVEGADSIEAMTKRFPILAIVRESEDEILAQSMRGLIDDYLVRPIDELVLRSKVESLLYGKYVSPFQFFELREGSEPIMMTVRIQLEYLSENQVRFRARSPLTVQNRLMISLGELLVPVNVESCEDLSDGLNTGYLIQCRVTDNLPFEQQVRLRRFIFGLMNQRNATLDTMIIADDPSDKLDA